MIASRAFRKSSHMTGTINIAIAEPYPHCPVMETIRIGYARCSTLSQDLEAQRKSLCNSAFTRTTSTQTMG